MKTRKFSGPRLSSGKQITTNINHGIAVSVPQLITPAIEEYYTELSGIPAAEDDCHRVKNVGSEDLSEQM